MEIKPVTQNEEPKYPKKEQFDKRLLNNVPKRWSASAAAKAALGTLAAVSLTACAPIEIQTPGVPMPPAATSEATVCPTVSPEDTFYRTEGIVAAPTVNVAPLFLHGEGRGAYGGDMASMPAFLSEDEALSVINEAAKEYGLNFSSEGSPEFTNVPQPATNIYEPENKKPADKTITLKTDFTDSEHGVVIEYISVDDLKQWQPKTEYVSTLEQYYTQDAAEQLSEGLEAAATDGYYNAAVLYDPCELAKTEAESRSLSKEQLKAQAKDFFEWLKIQGLV